jgi:hypothetical protein
MVLCEGGNPRNGSTTMVWGTHPAGTQAVQGDEHGMGGCKLLHSKISRSSIFAVALPGISGLQAWQTIYFLVTERK